MEFSHTKEILYHIFSGKEYDRKFIFYKFAIIT